VARGVLDRRDNIELTKNYIKKALEYQVSGKGFTFIEALASCPTDWHKSVSESENWIQSDMSKAFPPGVLLDRMGVI